MRNECQGHYANFFQRVERFHVTRRKIINEKKMNDAQTPCGKFMYIALRFRFFHSRTRATLNDHSFLICVTDCPEQEKMPCCKKTIHTNCLMKWYQSQQEKHLWPSCPHCRADPPSTVLEALGVHPSPPTPFHWETAQNHIEYWNYTWDESIPIERDVFFYNIFRKGYRIILCCMERIVDCIWSRFIDMRIEEYREAIEAIRRFRFVSLFVILINILKVGGA